MGPAPFKIFCNIRTFFEYSKLFAKNIYIVYLISDETFYKKGFI